MYEYELIYIRLKEKYLTHDIDLEISHAEMVDILKSEWNSAKCIINMSNKLLSDYSKSKNLLSKHKEL
jgi:DNA repair protein RadC